MPAPMVTKLATIQGLARVLAHIGKDKLAYGVPGLPSGPSASGDDVPNTPSSISAPAGAFGFASPVGVPGDLQPFGLNKVSHAGLGSMTKNSSASSSLARYLAEPGTARAATALASALGGGAVGGAAGGLAAVSQAPEGSGWDAMVEGGKKGAIGGAILGGLGGARAASKITKGIKAIPYAAPAVVGGAGGAGLGYLTGDKYKNPTYAQMVAMGQAR